MEQRISLITLVVADVSASRRFYLDGLGWEAFFGNDEVLMIQTGERLLLSLWDRTSAEGELGPVMTGAQAPPITLAHNLAEEAGVDAVLDDARRAGASLVESAQRREWGGYSGYFADPDGYRWEVAVNPGASWLVP